MPKPTVRPSLKDLRRGQFSKHKLADKVTDDTILTCVEIVFAPTPPSKPFDDLLVQQLLASAPPPGSRRVSRRQVTRQQWLCRADEVARAWGRPLFGAAGLAPHLPEL